MIIYQITNLINGKLYIGQTTRKMEDRFYAHTKQKSILNDAINKYGVENFEVKQIDFAENLIELNNKEIYWIDKLNSMLPNGYNVKPGGGGGGKLTDEIKEKLSKAKKGIKRTSEQKARMSEACKGRKHTEETKKKISQSAKEKNLISYALNSSKTHSPEVEKRRSKTRALKRQKLPCLNKHFGFKGVSPRRGRNSWQATINYDGNCVYIGTFSCKIEAAKAYDKMARIHHEPGCYLNFPDEK